MNQPAQNPPPAAAAAAATPAASTPAHAPTPAPGIKRKRGLLAKLAMPLIILTSLALILFIRVGFLFILLGLLPSIVAYYFDHSEDRNLFKTVLACNLTGMIPLLTPLLRPGADPVAFLTLIKTPMAWLIVFSGAAVGWVLVWICRYLSYGALSVLYKSELHFMESAQKKLLDEWGPQIKRRG